MADQKENLALPAPRQTGNASAVPERFYAPSIAYTEQEPEEPTVPLSHYLWIIKRHRWRILAFVVSAVIATIVVSSRITPIYESTATIDIDREMPAAVVGQGSEANPAYDMEQFLATQIRLIQSDSVLRPVVQKFKMPVARPANGKSSVPTTRAEEAPVGLGGLRVVRPPNTYLLLLSYRSPDPQLAADVANAVARSYINHTWDIRFEATRNLSGYMEKQLEYMKTKMEASAEALNRFEKEMNVIDPEQKTNILSDKLLRLNAEMTSAQADRVRKESEYNSVKNGSLEAAQAATQGDQVRKLSEALSDAERKFAGVKLLFGPNYPEYKKAAAAVEQLKGELETLQAGLTQRVGIEYKQAMDRESMLKKAVDESKEEFDRLGEHSYQYKAVKQEADTDKGLYQDLLKKIREAGINSSFQNSSIRMADDARPAMAPVYPNVQENVILAFLFSLVFAIGAAIMADIVDNTVRDPDHIQRGFKTTVLGSLPVVKSWRGRLPAVLGVGGSAVQSRRTGQVSSFEEAVRTLRDSILLSDPGRRPRSLLVTSATPREGKTTTTTYLAVAHSLQKRKTLLIDADLRRPGIHTRLGISNERGLSAVVNEGASWRELVQTPKNHPYLDVLVAGSASRRAADRLGIVLSELLAEAEKDYDLVLVDSPPLLGFAEPLQMAAVVDGVVVITLAGQTNRNAVGSVLNSLKRLKANVIGVALNEVREDMSDRYYYYGYYGKYYSRYYKKTAE